MDRKIALVTGGSRGIGAATASRLGSAGYAVCLTYKNNLAQAKAVVENIERIGGVAMMVQADVCQEADILRIFTHVEQTWGTISALVNNVGESTLTPIETLDTTQLQQLFAVNFFSTAICCREAVKHMKKSGGAIVNVSSEAAKFGGSQMLAYAAAKAAVSTFTIGLAREVAMQNIRINAVSPGVIDTDMNMHLSEERISTLKQSLPMGRLGEAREVADVIAWLLSEEASYVSGSIFPVTGGR
jgi:NAD(P)-dependent dehydrogenase (short-subunit alcohol dehydrogenase family)